MPQNPPFNPDPRKNRNIDPRTGEYNADPMWRRYDPEFNPPQPLSTLPGAAIDKLKEAITTIARPGLGSRPIPGADALKEGMGNLEAGISHEFGFEPGSPGSNLVQMPRRAVRGIASASLAPFRWLATAPKTDQPLASAHGPDSSNAPIPEARSDYFTGPLQTPALDGLQAATPTRLDVKAPFTRPGALPAPAAASTFQASQPEQKPTFAPSIQELFQLASRKDWNNFNPEARTGYGYGVAPGSSEGWGQELKERIAEEEFGLPEAETARQMEMYKIGGPERVAGITGASDLAKARLTGEYGLKGIESKGGQALNMMEQLGQLGRGGTDISRFSVPGGPSVSFARKPVIRIPPVLEQEVQRARAAYMDTVNPLTGNPDPTAKANYDQTRQAVILSADIPDGMKDFLSDIITDPELSAMSLEDIIQQRFQPGEVDPAEIETAQVYLNFLRGQ